MGIEDKHFEYEQDDFIDTNKPGIDDIDEDVDNTGDSGGHSWHVPVSKLIKDDEMEVGKKSKRTNRRKETEITIDKQKKTARKNTIVVEIPTVKVGDEHDDKVIAIIPKISDSEKHDSKVESNKYERDKDKQLNKLATNVNKGDTLDTLDFSDSESDMPPKQKSTKKRASKQTATRKRTSKSTKNTSNTSEPTQNVSDTNNVEVALETGDHADGSNDDDGVQDTGTKKRKKTTKNQQAAKKRKTNTGNAVI